MDLRDYYLQLRQAAESITDEHPIVVSKATPDGGKAGVLTEVTRATAAKLVVEGKAKLASSEEAESYRAALREEKQKADQEAAAARLQITVVSDSEMRGLRDRVRPIKG